MKLEYKTFGHKSNIDALLSVGAKGEHIVVPDDQKAWEYALEWIKANNHELFMPMVNDDDLVLPIIKLKAGGETK